MTRFTLFLSLLLPLGLAAQPISWITECSDKTFCLNLNSCAQGEVFLTEKAVTNCGSPNISYSYRIDLNNDNVMDIQSFNDTVSGGFAEGTHRIVWRANDNCGNLIQCTYLFTIKDCQPPNLLCINGLTQSLAAPDCALSFTPSQFILNLSDNCTPNNELEFGIRKAGDGMGFPNQDSITFGSCEKGLNPIEVWVRDQNGLANVCNNYVVVQDGENECDCNNDADIYFNGCAKSGGNLKLSNFKLNTSFETAPGTLNPFSANSSQTIEDSCYTVHLEDIPFGNDYVATIRGERRSGPLTGVTTFDLVLISKHILGLEPFTSLYQTVAADVSNSKSVTTFDIVETRKLILGIYDSFPLVPAWRITRPAPNPAQVSNFNALVDTYQIVLNNLVDDRTFNNLNFVGIKYGDVNGSALLTGEPGADDRYTAPPMLLQAKDQWLKKGEEAVVTFHLTETSVLEGWQLAMDAEPSKVQIVGLEGLPEDHYVLHGHEIRALWADGAGQVFDSKKAIFRLKIKALQDIQVSEALFLNAEKLRPEIYTVEGPRGTERRPMILHFGEQSHASATFFPPRPNPFATETTFEILTEKPASVLLEVFDLNGRKVVSQTYNVGSGLQTIRLLNTDLPGKGVFAYRISAGEAVGRGRLVRT